MYDLFGWILLFLVVLFGYYSNDYVQNTLPRKHSSGKLFRGKKEKDLDNRMEGMAQDLARVARQQSREHAVVRIQNAVPDKAVCKWTIQRMDDILAGE